MLSLLLILLVVFVATTLLLAAGTLFLQGYFNETPPDIQELLWRAPAASGAVFVLLLLWTFLGYRSPEKFAPLTDFSARTDSEFVRELWANSNGQEVKYTLRRSAQGRSVYRDSTGNPLPARPDEVQIKEGEERVRFRPELDDQGKFKEDGTRGLRYLDERGRVMREGYLGQFSNIRTGGTILYVLLNLVHGGIWFVCLWLLLRFSVGQAIVLSLTLWASTTLLVLPPILIKARDVAQQRAQPGAQTPASAETRGQVADKRKKGEPEWLSLGVGENDKESFSNQRQG